MKIFPTLANKIPHKTKYIPPKAKIVELKDLKLGKEINSGYSASVYKIKGFKSLVVKTTRPEAFPYMIWKWDMNPYTHSILSTDFPKNKSVIMKRVPGKPLYGKEWSMQKVPSAFKFKNQIKKLIRVPDEAYADYMKQVIELRKHGYNIDRINPNNILYDKKTKRFGIVDIEKELQEPKIIMDDFSPFVDDSRLFAIYENTNGYNRSQIIKLVRKLFDKIINVSKKNGYQLSVDNYDPYNFQNTSVYLYHNLRDTLDRLASRSFR